jgi:hypothetical protein
MIEFIEIICFFLWCLRLASMVCKACAAPPGERRDLVVDVVMVAMSLHDLVIKNIWLHTAWLYVWDSIAALFR